MEEVKKMLDEMNKDFSKYMTDELAKLKPEIEANPSIGLIKELLGELPVQIEMIKEKAIFIERFLMDYKVMIKSMKTEVELEKSKIRIQGIDEYQKQNKDFVNEAKTLINEVADGKKKLPTAIVQELLKTIKPEKPTQSYLDDLANIRTKEKQEKILKCEMQYNEIHEILSRLENLARKYENKDYAVKAHKKLMENTIKYNL